MSEHFYEIEIDNNNEDIIEEKSDFLCYLEMAKQKIDQAYECAKVGGDAAAKVEVYHACNILDRIRPTHLEDSWRKE